MLVVEPAAHEMHEKSPRVAARRDRRLHLAVLPGKVEGDGSGALLRNADRHPATGCSLLSPGSEVWARAAAGSCCPLPIPDPRPVSVTAPAVGSLRLWGFRGGEAAGKVA